MHILKHGAIVGIFHKETGEVVCALCGYDAASPPPLPDFSKNPQWMTFKNQYHALYERAVREGKVPGERNKVVFCS